MTELANKGVFIDIEDFLEKETGFKFKNLNDKKIDELLAVLDKLPPDQVVIRIEDNDDDDIQNNSISA